MDSPHTEVPATVPALIDAFGGPAAYARVIGKGSSTAGEQKRTGSIPVVYWDLIVEAAPGAGIVGLTYESLVRMHAPARRPAEARA